MFYKVKMSFFALLEAVSLQMGGPGGTFLNLADHHHLCPGTGGVVVLGPEGAVAPLFVQLDCIFSMS